MSTENPALARRSDLDALRAGAMLLGIVLHASLSFFPSFWMVTDTRQNDVFGIVFSAIHGFRMPLFFVMSGFFSAMLLHRRGRGALVKHRFRRVFLPLAGGDVHDRPAHDGDLHPRDVVRPAEGRRRGPGGEGVDDLGGRASR